MTKILDLKDEWRKCIEACSKCHNVCIETSAYSLQKCDKFCNADHIAVLYDCADMCQASVNSMSRKCDLARKICETCALICDECSQSCEKMNDEKLKECAKICRECAEHCRKMATVPAY